MKKIVIIPVRLSDGGHVYDVAICDRHATAADAAVFHAVTETDAIAFADALAALVEKHTVDEAEVKFQWNSMAAA